MISINLSKRDEKLLKKVCKELGHDDKKIDDMCLAVIDMFINMVRKNEKRMEKS